MNKKEEIYNQITEDEYDIHLKYSVNSEKLAEYLATLEDKIEKQGMALNDLFNERNEMKERIERIEKNFIFYVENHK